MDEDFPGLFRVDGSLYAFSKRIHSLPVQLVAEFENDGDWVSIGTDNRLLDYHVQVFLPEQGLVPTFGQYQWAVFDADLNELDSGEQDFRVTFSVRSFSNARYLRITADSRTDFDSTTGQPFDLPSYYRVAAGQQGDAVGDTTATAQPYENNYNGVLGGSLLDGDDVDFYSVELELGVGYEFMLFGDAGLTNQTSDLLDPVFEIHTVDGYLAGSIRRGNGNERLLSFTTNLAGTYYLKVATDAEFQSSAFSNDGGYIIRSPQFDDDDLAPTSMTRGVVNPGETFSNSVDFAGDVDWAKLNTQAYFAYQVAQSLGDDIALVVKSGAEAPSEDWNSRTQILHPVASRDLFVQFSGDENADFLFEALDEHENLELSLATRKSEQFQGAIETAGDVDLFKVDLVPFVDYSLSVVESVAGAWSGNLVLEALNTNGSIGRTFNVNADENVFTFNASDGTPATDTQYGIRRQQYFRVRSDNDEVTGYQLTFSATNEDSVPNRLSTSNLLPMPGGIARVRNVLEGSDDWDVYRVELKANKYYELKGFPSPSGSVSLFRAIDGGSEEVTPMYLNNRLYYRFQQPGTYYVAAGRTNSNASDGFAGYEFTFTEDAVPVPSIRQFYTADSRPFQNRYGGRNLPTEVWSEQPLQYATSEGVVNIPSRTLTQLTTDQWRLLKLAPTATGPGDVVYRNILGNGARLPWEKFELVNNKRIPAFANVNVFSEFQDYWFAETLPSYLSSDTGIGASFQPVDALQQALVVTAINRWRDVTGTLPPANGPTDGRQMQIYQLDLGTDGDVVSSFHGDTGLAGDLILNSRSPLFSGNRTPEAIFQLLRGIGTSIGLPTIDSVDRFTSVMGAMPVEGVNADIYPGAPMSADLRVGSIVNYSFSNRTVYRFPASGGIVESVLSRPLDPTEINADEMTQSVSIDLRPGESSSVLGDGPVRTFHMSPGTPGYKAVGGSNHDGIRGNFRANVLIGNAGNDVINGGSGNDRLFGGPGDDYYIFNTASGLDFVDEEDGGGVDVLRIEGMYDYDSIADDFTFRRFGNDLLIRLELDGQRNNNGDQIRISNMGTETSRVEAMALLNTDGFVNRISLQSVWEQSTEARQRFQIVAGNDGFGTMVSPV